MPPSGDALAEAGIEGACPSRSRENCGAMPGQTFNPVFLEQLYLLYA